MRFRWLTVVTMLFVGACTGGSVDGTSATASTSTTAVPQSSTSAAPSTSQPIVSSTTLEVPTTVVSPPDRAEPIDGWEPSGIDSSVFRSIPISDAVVFGDQIIAVGCPPDGLPGSDLPVWVSNDAVAWTRVVGDALLPWGRIDCLQQVQSTPLGLFAHGFGLLRSTDGTNWERIEFLDDEGYSLGTIDALFSIDDRVTVLLQRGAEAESTVATLFTTTDGESWEEGPPAEMFGSSGVGQVVPGGDGLLAVGASPWGEFVPTAAVWTSADGMNWHRVTPRSGGGLEAAFMHDVVQLRGTFVSVGGDPFASDLMASWTSADGHTWRRSPPPIGDEAAEHGFMEAFAVSNAGGKLFAIGRDFDASRGDDGRPAVWESGDGITWTRRQLQNADVAIPFAIVEFEGRRVGFWPPSGWPAVEPVQVLTER